MKRNEQVDEKAEWVQNAAVSVKGNAARSYSSSGVSLGEISQEVIQSGFRCWVPEDIGEKVHMNGAGSWAQASGILASAPTLSCTQQEQEGEVSGLLSLFHLRVSECSTKWKQFHIHGNLHENVCPSSSWSHQYTLLILENVSPIKILFKIKLPLTPKWIYNFVLTKI